jgi:cation-transporting ATPase E
LHLIGWRDPWTGVAISVGAGLLLEVVWRVIRPEAGTEAGSGTAAGAAAGAEARAQVAGEVAAEVTGDAAK